MQIYNLNVNAANSLLYSEILFGAEFVWKVKQNNYDSLVHIVFALIMGYSYSLTKLNHIIA